MPVKPEVKTLTASSMDIINSIWYQASQRYQDSVPQYDGETANLRSVGAAILENTSNTNEFLSALMNRIGRVIISSRMYTNPLAMFKKGMLEYGETIEDIFVEIARPFEFNQQEAEQKVFKREIPDVRSAFYKLNYKKFYKETISYDMLKTAFLSPEGVTNLVSKIVDVMYTAAIYEESLVMKYLLAKEILAGNMKPVAIPTASASNAKEITSTIKGVSNAMTFMSKRYNIAGVRTHSDRDRQYILVNCDFDAIMDVEVLASAFNMNKADFLGHRVLVDDFGELDLARLSQLFAEDPNYTPLSSDELLALKEIPAVIVDRDWFMVFDNLTATTEVYNSEGLYWNYTYHVWKTFAISPFANNAIFLPPGVHKVTDVTVLPDTVELSVGDTQDFVATVIGTGVFDKDVVWSVDGTDSTIGEHTGVLEVGADEESTELTVTATSVADPTVSGTATVTIVETIVE